MTCLVYIFETPILRTESKEEAESLLSKLQATIYKNEAWIKEA